MDSSSRKIVAIIAIFTLTVLAVMAGSFYTKAQNAENTAAVEPPAPLNDEAEADKNADTTPKAGTGFSSDVPTAEEIPAITGAPSMVFDNDGNADTQAAQESSKSTWAPSALPSPSQTPK
jgi:hypothetical protein